MSPPLTSPPTSFAKPSAAPASTPESVDQVDHGHRRPGRRRRLPLAPLRGEGRPPDRHPGHEREPHLRLRPRGHQHRLPPHPERRRRGRGRRRRREHDAHALLPAQGPQRLPPRPRRASKTASFTCSATPSRATTWASPPRTWPISSKSAAPPRTSSPRESQRRAIAAIDAGRFEDADRPDRPSRSAAKRRSSISTSTLAPPRPKRSAKLRPAFKEGGVVTAGNASGINDGAAARRP